MKFLLPAAAIAACLGFGAQAAVLDFITEANGNERGVHDGTTINMDGLDVTFSSVSGFAYFDSGDAGLGSCSYINSHAQCAPSSDDSIDEHEDVTISFLEAQTVNGLMFTRGGTHGVVDPNRTLTIAINGGSAVEYTFAQASAETFSNVFSATFGYGANHPGEYYLAAATAVAAVPLPASILLLGGAVGGLGAMRRRRKAS